MESGQLTISFKSIQLWFSESRILASLQRGISLDLEEEPLDLLLEVT
jgi:hypothetical protein